MDLNDLMKVLDENNEHLKRILNECKDGPNELALLSSIMEPILDHLSACKSELMSTDISKNDDKVVSTGSDVNNKDGLQS